MAVCVVVYVFAFLFLIGGDATHPLDVCACACVYVFACLFLIEGDVTQPLAQGTDQHKPKCRRQRWGYLESKLSKLLVQYYNRIYIYMCVCVCINVYIIKHTQTHIQNKALTSTNPSAYAKVGDILSRNCLFSTIVSKLSAVINTLNLRGISVGNMS